MVRSLQLVEVRPYTEEEEEEEVVQTSMPGACAMREFLHPEYTTLYVVTSHTATYLFICVKHIATPEVNWCCLIILLTVVGSKIVAFSPCA